MVREEGQRNTHLAQLTSVVPLFPHLVSGYVGGYCLGYEYVQQELDVHVSLSISFGGAVFPGC